MIAYNAFISYSHEADEALAADLERALEALARPWYKRRALSVFRDGGNLNLSSHLWRSIQKALDASDFFVYLASPAAARSPWVAREIEYWISHRDIDRLIFVLTDGSLNWRAEGTDFDPASTAVPAVLQGVMAGEPFFVDMRWSRTAARSELSLRGDRFRRQVVQIAATLRNMAVEDLVGEEVAQHRRMLRIRNAAIGSLAALTIAALTLAGVAVAQRRSAIQSANEARTQQQRAQEAALDADLRRRQAEAAENKATASEALAKTNAEEANRQRIVAERETALAEGRLMTATALRVNSEAQAMWQGTRAGGQRLAMLKMLAAYRLAPHTEVESALATQLSNSMPVEKIFDAASVAPRVAFSPDGTRIVSAGRDRAIRLWDPDTGQPIGAPLVGHDGNVTSVLFSPDGKRLVSGSDDGTVRIWDVATGRLVGAPLRGHQGSVQEVAVSPDGSRIVSRGADATLRLWNAVSGEPLRALAGSDSVHSVAFSPDGERIVGGEIRGWLRMWHGSSGEPIVIPARDEKDWFRPIAFSRDGTRIISGHTDGLRFWDAATLRPIGYLRRDPRGVWAIGVSPTSEQIASGGDDHMVRIWDTRTGTSVGEPLGGHDGPVTGVAFSPDGKRLVSASYEGTVRIWSLMPDRQAIKTHAGGLGCPLRAAVSHDGKYIVAASNCGGGQIFDGVSRTQIGDLATHVQGNARSATFSPTAWNIVAATSRETITLFDVVARRAIRSIVHGHDGGVDAISFSSDGKRLATGGIDKTVRVWNVNTGEPIGAPMSGHKEIAAGLVFLPNRSVISASGDGGILRWDANTGRALGAPWSGPRVGSIAPSPDGSRLVVGEFGILRVRDTTTGRVLASEMKGHSGSVSAVVFNRDGTRIVSGANDGMVRLWDSSTGQPIGLPWRGHTGPVNSVAFNADETRIISGSWDTTIRFWPAPKVYADELCAKLTTNLNRQQWRELVSADIEYRPQCPGLPIPSDDSTPQLTSKQ